MLKAIEILIQPHIWLVCSSNLPYFCCLLNPCANPSFLRSIPHIFLDILLLLSIPLKWPTFSTQTLQLFARLQDALGEQHIIFQLLWALCALQAWQWVCWQAKQWLGGSETIEEPQPQIPWFIIVFLVNMHMLRVPHFQTHPYTYIYIYLMDILIGHIFDDGPTP